MRLSDEYMFKQMSAGAGSEPDYLIILSLVMTITYLVFYQSRHDP